MRFLAKDSEKYQFYQKRLVTFLELHLELLKYENEMCKTYKYEDLDAYMDSMM
jgi:hypothetical protein